MMYWTTPSRASVAPTLAIAPPSRCASSIRPPETGISVIIGAYGITPPATAARLATTRLIPNAIPTHAVRWGNSKSWTTPPITTAIEMVLVTGPSP